MMLFLVVIGSGVGQLAPPYDPLGQDFGQRLKPPTWGHPLGTDQFGRDVMSRLMAGGLPVLIVSISSTLVAVGLGVPIGVLCSAAGRVGSVVSRALDGVQAFPSILLALVWVTVLQPSYGALIWAMGLSFFPLLARVTQASVDNELPRDYVLAARTIGQRPLWILARHVLPNATSALLVQATTVLALAMLNEAALSFLGLGPPSGSPTWGRMLYDARGFLELAPYLTLAPLLAIAGTVLACNLLGDGLRDALDPTIAAQRLG